MGIIQQASGTWTGTSFTPTLPGASTAANTVVVIVAGNTTVTTPGSWTLRTSQVNFMGHYLYDISGTSITSVAMTAVTGQGTWWIAETDGAYDGSQSQNNTANASTYNTPNLTPTAGARNLYASIGSLAGASGAARTVSGWTNSFVEQADVCYSGTDFPMQGVAALTVAADGSTAYNTTATYSSSLSDGRSAIIGSYAGPTTSVTRVAVTTGAPAAATAFTPTLPTHATGDRMILAVVGKDQTTTIPTINQSWVLVGSGTGGTGSIAADTGQTFWAVYAKDATSSSETAPTVTPGGTAPNSWEWICATHRPAPGETWADAIGASAAWVQSASDTTTASPLTGTAGAWTGVQPTADDAIFAVGVIPTDLGTALGATTLTATGLSGGTKTTATSQYVENALGLDTAAVWAGWTGFTGTASAGLAVSFTVTGATNQSGSLIAVALRQQAAPSGFTGTAAVAIAVDLSVDDTTLETADRTVAATITATGVVSTAGSATRPITIDVTAAGGLTGGNSSTAAQSVAVAITAAGVTSGQATRSESVNLTASGQIVVVGQATRSNTVTLTATGVTSGQATRPNTVTLTATGLLTLTGQAPVNVVGSASDLYSEEYEEFYPGTFGALASQATRSITTTLSAPSVVAARTSADVAATVNRTASSGVPPFERAADRANTVTLTAQSATLSQSSRATTVGVTATGVVLLSTTAAQAVTATITVSGQLPTAPSGTASVAGSVTLTASGLVVNTTTANSASTVTVTAVSATGGTTVRAATVDVTATGLVPSGLIGTADRSNTVTVTAAGRTDFLTTADRANTVNLTASGQLPSAPSGTADRPNTVSITETHRLNLSVAATQPVTVDVTATGQIPPPLNKAADRPSSVNVTATGNMFSAGNGARAATVTITAAGVLRYVNTAHRAAAVDTITVGVVFLIDPFSYGVGMPGRGVGVTGAAGIGGGLGPSGRPGRETVNSGAAGRG